MGVISTRNLSHPTKSSSLSARLLWRCIAWNTFERLDRSRRSTALYGTRPARIRELDPRRYMIAGLFLSAHIAIDARRFEAMRHRRTQQDMVDAQSCVAAVGVPEIIREGIDTLDRMECPQRIGPALGRQSFDRPRGLPGGRGRRLPIAPACRRRDRWA
jgi:hypothetical protein